MNALTLLARRTSVLAMRRVPSVKVFRALSTKVYPFAVEAPDGTSEALMDAELREVEDVVDHAAKYEDPAFVQELHQQQEDAAKVFAVDGPDGESEDIHLEDLHAVEDVIDFAAEHENKEKVIEAHKLEEDVKKFMTKRAGFPDY